MKVKTLGAQTDLMFSRFGGEVHDEGHYLVIRTPGNPTYHWGNYLLFDRAPIRGDYEPWLAAFERHFPGTRETSHLILSWDTETPQTGDPTEFLAQGMTLDDTNVMTMSRTTRPSPTRSDVDIRRLASDGEWDAAVELQVTCADDCFNKDEMRLFKRRLFGQYREMSEAGMGHWFGVYEGSRMVADLGLFHEQGLGRYQSVETHPDFRRRGYCRALVNETVRQGFDELGLEHLVIEAETDSDAGRIYAAAGFAPTEQRHALDWSVARSGGDGSGAPPLLLP